MDVTLNPLLSSSNLAFSEGNLRVSQIISDSNPNVALASHGKVGGGNWYFEGRVYDWYLNPNPIHLRERIGITVPSINLDSTHIGSSTVINQAAAAFSHTQTLVTKKAIESSATTSGYFPMIDSSSVVGIAYSLCSGSVWFAIDNTWIGGGIPGAGATPAVTGINVIDGMKILPMFPAVSVDAGYYGGDASVTFKAADFSYDPPPGFYSVETRGYDYEDWCAFTGNGAIVGRVTEFSVPGAYEVFLLDQETMRLVKSVWSDPDGEYALENLSTSREFIVVALDHTDPKQVPVSQDHVVAS